MGQVTETVTVKAEVEAVNLVNGERSGTLTGDQLDEIALRGRDVFDAVSLMPGVVDTSDGRDAPSRPAASPTSTSWAAARIPKNMTIDGVSNLDTGSNRRYTACRRWIPSPKSKC